MRGVVQGRRALFCHKAEDSLSPPSRVGTQPTQWIRKLRSRAVRGNFRQALVLMP